MATTQHRVFTKDDVDLRPLTAPATWFPGALPRDIIKQLKKIDKNIILKWSPRFECWELWHRNPRGYEHIFYRHQGPGNCFLPADARLLKVIELRSRQSSWGQRREREENERMRQHLKEQNKTNAQKRKDQSNLLKGDFGADARAF